ncbi:hypothetical protein ACQUD0_04525 [Vagococcus fluvialis]|uniref:hypothetical protein n=1 Tax=Vagococcus fluvialis TaxID=2738 RepID=UPI0014328F07|nr:hypothetical protein [Vagococcus fluvialis]NKC58901.1 hypothetical protein [Vagococcus fluvialis]NKD49655.1 hypothetical protein [Vagococcus fluvialis]
MDQSEFIQAVNTKYSKTDNDKVLIPVMHEIFEYFRDINNKISDQNDIKMILGFNSKVADFILIELDENALSVKRSDEKIEIFFVSKKDNEFTKKYDHLLLNTLKIYTDNSIITADSNKFDTSQLDEYLKYLLA